VLRELEDDSVASTAGTKVSPPKPRSRQRTHALLYAFLVLAIAAITAGVVYFVLPSFT
jgi:hypothetical protein